jgi:diguanylate cyclase (GGDEF)-like protein/PAS domain S-box-containing protein
LSIAPTSLHETERLAALHELQLLGTEAEPVFDALTRTVAAVLEVPVALVSLVDAKRQWFKSKTGLEATETARDVAFCAHAIQDDKLFVVPDAMADERFVDNPLVTGQLGIRSYAGVPLLTVEGHAIGTLCAMDRKARRFTSKQIQLLQDLATIANREILGREQTVRAKRIAERGLQAVEERERLYRATVDSAGIGICLVGLDGRWLRINPRMSEILGRPVEDLYRLTFRDITHPDDVEGDLDLVRQLLAGQGSGYAVEKRYLRPDGSVVWGHLTVTLVRDEQGQAQHFISLLEDITRRRATEDALRQLRQQLEQRVEQRTAELQRANSALGESHASLQRLSREQQLMLDNELFGIGKFMGRDVLWANRAFEQMFGYGPGELLGESSRILYADDETFELVGREGRAAIKGDGTYRTQVEVVRKTGERFWVDLNGAKLSEEAGESLWMLHDITAMKRHQHKVEDMAFHDALTGLPNRALLLERLGQAIGEAHRAEQLVAVCFADLNGFKAVNDLHGHEAGDHLLREIAHRLTDTVRTNDTVARLGGDEFVVVLTALHAQAEVKGFLDRAELAMARDVVLPSGVAVNVSASFGVAIASDRSAEPSELIAQADARMYEAKRRSKA